MSTVALNGVPATDLAHTAYDVYHSMLRLHRQPWTAVAFADQIPWIEAATLAIATIDLPPDEKATLEISAKALAAYLYKQYADSKCDGTAFGMLAEKEQVAWEGIGRHLANIIDSEGGLEWPALEERIVAWAQQKIEPAQLVMS